MFVAGAQPISLTGEDAVESVAEQYVSGRSKPAGVLERAILGVGFEQSSSGGEIGPAYAVEYAGFA